MNRLLSISLIIVSISCIGQVSQEGEGPKTVRSTFDKMLDESNRYQDFKVIKRAKLDAFIIEVQDSLDVLHQRIRSEVKAKNELENQFNSLNQEIEKGETRISELEGQRDSISTLGMDVNKSAFSTGMWIAVLVLLGLLIAVFLRNKAIAMSQKAIRSNLGDLEDELSMTKKKALEREQELKREIQDYVNKIEAMGPPR